MPLPARSLTMQAAERLCARQFAPAEEQLVGIELEWPLTRPGTAAARPSSAEMNRVAGAPLPAGGRVTFEPGGQVELSSAPCRRVTDLLEAVRTEELDLRSRLGLLGWEMRPAAVDDTRRPGRVLELARYEAMENFFAEQGPCGSWMMTNTASTQINISHDEDDPATRWRTMHLIAPVLVAAFANSPGVGLDGTRWASVRQGIWASIDPARTRPVRADLPPAHAWLEYALGADVMFIGEPGSCGARGTGLAPGLAFGRWMTDGHQLGWPTVEDLRYHLSTLFPPIRPRGWLELRMLDALPAGVRDVAVLVAASCAAAGAGTRLRRLLPDTSRWWLAAARSGMDHPAIAAAARELFAVAADELGAVTDRPEHVAMLEQYRQDYVDAARSPGDDRESIDLSACLPVLA